MATLTAAQLDELATDYSNFADALFQYKIDNITTMTVLESNDLGSRIDLITHNANLLAALATYQTIADISQQLASIKQASTDVTNALATIKSVQSAINIATAVVALGSSIITFNAGGIVSNVSSLVTAINAA